MDSKKLKREKAKPESEIEAKPESDPETVSESDAPTSDEPEPLLNGPSSTSIVDISELGEQLVNAMPEPSEHAIDSHEDKERNKRAEFAHLKDVDGRAFDPAIHKTNSNGEPPVTKKGNLIKKPGRKPNTGTKRAESVIGGIKSDSPQADIDAQQRATSRATGAAAAALLIQIGIVAGGNEWQPIKDEKMGIDEQAMLQTAFADYFEATGKTDLPPGMALTVAIAGYTLPRFTMPKTQSRLVKLKNWAKKVYINRKLKKEGFKVEELKKGDESKPVQMAA